MTQSEQVLETELIQQLVGELKYDFVKIKDETDLLANLKRQLEQHNKVSLTPKEFEQVLNHLNKGNVWDRAKTLRDKMHLTKTDGTSVYLEFINMDYWCQNEFQVTHQITNEGSYKNRYDVTLLINGLPLVQIELKKRGLELKEAFNQINRYQRHSYGAKYGLFQYVQIFIISNGVNTKFYANNRDQSFKQTFFWSDEKNRPIKQLAGFAAVFLEKCHLAKMITKYTVLHEGDKILMILRPYQFYACEAIVDRVKNSNKNGYIWHTTGSGKTLTSFKASQILTTLPQVHKVVFVVDRKDLDYQTQREFDSFSSGSVDSSDNTQVLIDQFTDTYKAKDGKLKTTPLIVTTIQKLNNAISNKRHLSKMEGLKDKRIVFIFDECHRSQFGDTHNRIKTFFTNSQMFGFTGTPIFVDNAVKNERGKRTTKELFVECLHKYVITDAIRDENVLKFSVDYIGRYRQKDDSRTELDIEVEAIDKKELLESPQRLDKIVDFIIENHDRKTQNKKFSAIFCVSSVDALIAYYELFKAKKAEGKHDLRVVTIFSYTANEDDKDANGYIPDDDLDGKDIKVNEHSRDKLESFIADYNAQYHTKFHTRDSQIFYNYYQDIGKRFKEREKKSFLDKDRADILLVVNMFLTGFDAKLVNTMYADKNLKYHGLVQAFSRTNRIINETKSQGNIVSFRNLKKLTDQAIALFSNPEAKEEIILAPYQVYVKKFDTAYKDLIELTPSVKSVDELENEEEELDFIKKFRELLRLKNVLGSFSDFDFEDLAMEEQTFEDFKSKYLDLYDKVKSNRQKDTTSVLNDVDFELELLHRDDINVAYILRLLGQLKGANKEDQAKQRKQILDILTGEAQLRSKRELIEKFINDNMPNIADADRIPEEFDIFWAKERTKAFVELCIKERLTEAGLTKIISNHLFTGRKPMTDDIVKILTYKPTLFERRDLGGRITDKILDYVVTFEMDVVIG